MGEEEKLFHSTEMIIMMMMMVDVHFCYEREIVERELRMKKC